MVCSAIPTGLNIECNAVHSPHLCAVMKRIPTRGSAIFYRLAALCHFVATAAAPAEPSRTRWIVVNGGKMV